MGWDYWRWGEGKGERGREGAGGFGLEAAWRKREDRGRRREGGGELGGDCGGKGLRKMGVCIDPVGSSLSRRIGVRTMGVCIDREGRILGVGADG